MKALWQERYGGPETLTVRDVPAPVPGSGEVLVRVRAASIDLGTRHLMTGVPLVMRLGTGLRAPRLHVPGRALAGVVEAVGEGVTAFAPGDEVHGTTAGSLAELAVALEDRLAPRPASTSPRRRRSPSPGSPRCRACATSAGSRRPSRCW